MGNQSSTRLEGDYYQHLFSWYEMLELLDPDSPYAEAIVEQADAGAADDVTFHPRPGVPAPRRFVQVKWHVRFDQHYSFASLAKGTAESRALLVKLFESWRHLRGQGPLEVWLVSNWAPAADPDLGRYIGTSSHSLIDEFFTKGPRADVDEFRRLWESELRANREELMAFCRDLRFQLSFSSTKDLERRVDDRMARYGLDVGENAHAKAVHEIGKRVRAGDEEKRITREVLESIIERRELRARAPGDPAVRLWVHGWAKQTFEGQPTAELDFTGRFNRDERRVPTTAEWNDEILPSLRRARDEFGGLADGRYVDVRGRMPLTLGLATGFVLSDVAGFTLRIEQVTAGRQSLWRSDTVPSGARFDVAHEEGDPSDDLILGLSAIAPARDATLAMRATVPGAAVVCAEPASGLGPTSVAGAADAAALATSAKDLIVRLRDRYGAKRIHLLPYLPLGLALFLGQRLNAVGTVITYERTLDGDYQQSVMLRTG